ncbi:MAG: hypothetical protein AAGE52_30400 [Myxococcota bacterium]
MRSAVDDAREGRSVAVVVHSASFIWYVRDLAERLAPGVTRRGPGRILSFEGGGEIRFVSVKMVRSLQGLRAATYVDHAVFDHAKAHEWAEMDDVLRQVDR